MESIKNIFFTFEDLKGDVFSQIERNIEDKESNYGVKTGFKSLDQITLGLQKTDLVLLAARPSVGKTAFALNIAVNASIYSKKKVAFFSLEMSKEQLALRCVSLVSKIPIMDIKTGNLKSKDLKLIGKAYEKLLEAKIFIDDCTSQTTDELISKLILLKKEDSLDIAFIDYLQLIKPVKSKEIREFEVSEISRNLKIIAKELCIPVVALSQLNRKVEIRNDKRPMLSDLRESGALEQDSDVVIFLYRESVYGKTKYKSKSNTEIIIAKHRNGLVGNVFLDFNPEIMEFVEK